MISIVIWLLLSVLWGVIGWKNKMQTHLVPQSNELRCCDAYIEVILHDMRDLSKSLGCENQRGEEAWYLAHQIEEAMMYISVCIIVTDIYVVTWRISGDRFHLVGRSQVFFGLFWLKWGLALVCWAHLRTDDLGWMSLLRVFSIKPWKIDSVGLFSCWTYLCVVWQWRMHTCGRSKLNEAVESDDQGREDNRYLAHQIEEAIMYISVCIVVTSIYVVT